MTAFGILNFLAMALELCVPSYALRLVRRFGAAQVGSFVIIAFLSLALLHLFNPLKPWLGSGLALSLVYAVASVLLLIGMGHTETVCQQRQQAQVDEENLRRRLDSEARERADDLLKVKHQMAQEIVRLQQHVESLAASERQFRFLFIQHPHPMWIFDLRTGRILTGNEAALNQYGFTQQEFTTLTAKDLVAREANSAFLADAAKPCSGLECRGIWRHRKKDRSSVDVEVLSIDLRFGDCPARLMFTEDVSPRVLRETELCESQRNRILRCVAQGVAHHFGQILSIVEGQAGLLRDAHPDATQADHLEQVLAETRRGSALIRQLLAVGACEAIQPEAIDLNHFLQTQLNLLRRLVGERITIEFQLAEGLPPVLADSRALESIVYNLLLNARDALPHGGNIGIQTDAVWLDPRQTQRLANSSPGHFIHLTIRDNGCGMSSEVQEHVFEPFFTTRNNAKAMGLGLPSVYGAAKQHGGWIEFVSEAQRGTEFHVYLPAAQLELHVGNVQPAALAPPARGTIMLVEANDRVRDLARHILQRNGYRVIEADGPSTAVLLMESQAANIQLVLTDLTFPSGTGGRELAEQLRQFKNDLKIVYSTGPLAPEDKQPALLESKLLLKPYTPDQLLQAVASSLG